MNTVAPVGNGAVASPCNHICRIEAATGCCEGCLRTLDEISAWSGMSDDEKRAVSALLPQRRVRGAVTPPLVRSGLPRDEGRE